MSSLQTRLQDPDYINWVKAGLCLIHTKSGLEEFAETASQSLHQSILAIVVPPTATAAQPICGVNIGRHKLVANCAHPYCQNFIKEVINMGFDPNHAFTVNHGNLRNCDVTQWHSHHWELAKIFMNPGQLPAQVSASQTDMSGILNFISHCKVPRQKMGNILSADEVRKARNGIMHTSGMKLSAGELQAYSQSMIDLLSDPGVACFGTAQDAVTEIQTIINAADFKITLEDERKVIDDLAAEIRTLAEEIRQEVDAVAQKGDAERQSIKEKIDEEIKKVSNLKDMVEQIAGTQSQMEGTIAILTDQLKNLRAFETKLNDIEQQQQELAKQQEACQRTVEAHDKDLANLKTRFDDLTTTSDPIPTDEDKKRLREYLQNIYTDSDYSKVTPLPDWVEIHVRDIFTPVILVGDRKDDKKQRLETYNELFHKAGIKQNKKQRLESYKELFHEKGVELKKIMLLGEAGAGKTTFCQHLVDVWSNPSSRRQFDDVDIIKQFQFLFYISCRFATNNEDVVSMIEKQLFDDENRELRDIACSVLRHNAESCLILMDGFDELQRSAQARTGKRGDITGMPSLTNIQNCTLVSTSRPWKFLSIPKYEQEKFSCLQLDGIKDMAELIKTIFQELQVENPAKSCTDFLNAIEERNLSDLMKFPIMLLFAIDVWGEEGSLPKSVNRCYINMIKLAISRSALKREEANVESKSKKVDKLLKKYSESAEYLPNPLSNFECLQQNAGLLLHLAQLAYDLLLRPDGQTLVFQMDDCKKYSIHKLDGSLEYCLDLGLLIKIESTVKGFKQKENFQFCHKTYQEFFAALWLSYMYTKEGSQEMSHLQSCIKSYTDLNNHSVLIQFLCGLCPEAGAELWKYVAQNDNIKFFLGYREAVQNQVLRAVKEAQDCCDHQGVQVYYCIRVVDIDKDTTDEDVSLLCKMIQNNSCYLKYLRVLSACLSSSQYHSLLSSASSAIELDKLRLENISCQSNDSSANNLPVLDLSKHCRLQLLLVNEISISGLVLPSQEGSQLSTLYLNNLVLPHDKLVNICSSLSSGTELQVLNLDRVSCSEHQDSCCLAALDVSNHCRLQKLLLQKTSISGLVLPSQEGSQLSILYLINLVLPHDSLVNLCSSLSSGTELQELNLDRVSCSEHQDSCCLAALDVSNHCRLHELLLQKTSISGLVLPSQEGSQLRELYLNSLVLPHDNLVNICSSLSSGTQLQELNLDRVSCSEHQDSCCLAALDVSNHRRLHELLLKKTSISSLVLPSQEGSRLSTLYLNNLVLPHDKLVGLCSVISSLSSIMELQLTHIRCSNHDGSRDVPTLNLPKQESDNVVEEQLPDRDVSSLSGLDKLKLPIMPCSKTSDACRFTVLNLQKHRKLYELKLDSSSISGILLPSHDRIKIKVLVISNLVLSHYSLEQLPRSLSTLSARVRLHLVNLSCSDHGGSCELPSLYWPDTELKNIDIDEILDFSDDDSDSDGSESD